MRWIWLGTEDPAALLRRARLVVLAETAVALEPAERTALGKHDDTPLPPGAYGRSEATRPAHPKPGLPALAGRHRRPRRSGEAWVPSFLPRHGPAGLQTGQKASGSGRACRPRCRAFARQPSLAAEAPLPAIFTGWLSSSTAVGVGSWPSLQRGLSRCASWKHSKMPLGPTAHRRIRRITPPAQARQLQADNDVGHRLQTRRANLSDPDSPRPSSPPSHPSPPGTAGPAALVPPTPPPESS